MSGRSGDKKGLTAAQRALFDEHAELPQEAAAAALETMGAACFRHLEWDDLVSTATVAVMEATQTFDPSRRSSFRTWAFFAAMYRVIDAGRLEVTGHMKARAGVIAGLLTYFQTAETAPIDLGFETVGSLEEKIRAFANPSLHLVLKEVASQAPTPGGEDELVERVAAERAHAALREVMPEEGSEERKVLEMLYVEGMPLTEVAAAFGATDPAEYQVFRRRHLAVLERMRKALKRMGVKEAPRRTG